MAQKPRTMVKGTGLKARLEEAAAGKINLPGVPPGSIGPINLFAFLGAFVGTTGQQDFPSSVVTWRNLVFDNVTHESPAPMLDVSGVAATDSNGKSTFRLTTFVGVEIDAAEPIHIVATAHGAAPVFLTADHTIVGADIEATIYSWDASGKPAPDVAFDWRCRFVANII